MARRELTQHQLAQGLRWELWRAATFKRLQWPEHEGNAQRLADGYLEQLQFSGEGIGLAPPD